MKILILDNYDSFTYNLVHLVEKIISGSVDVYRNDKISLDAVAAYDKIILSPGPGLPAEAGIMNALIQRYAPVKPILGVCLGHQAIGEVFGAGLLNLDVVFHGVATNVSITGRKQGYDIFKGLPDTFLAGRYHSWVVRKDSLPEDIIITAEDESGLIMGIRHAKYPVYGVQFHPESILTPQGETILKNWLTLEN